MNLNSALVECFAAVTAMSLHEENSEINFTKFQELLEKHRGRLHPAKLKLLCAHEYQFCLKQYENGNTLFLPRLFELYKRHLKEGFLYENGTISQTLFYGIIEVGMKMQAFDWVEKFVLEHRDRIAGASKHKYALAVQRAIG